MDLCWDFIKKEETIILAVTAATVDIQTSEAISQARRADPDGLRTIGVLTKPDKQNKGAELDKMLEVLRNETVQVRKGYFVIKNRSENQIREGMSAEEALKVRTSQSLIISVFRVIIE